MKIISLIGIILAITSCNNSSNNADINNKIAALQHHDSIIDKKIDSLLTTQTKTKITSSSELHTWQCMLCSQVVHSHNQPSLSGCSANVQTRQGANGAYQYNGNHMWKKID